MLEPLPPLQYAALSLIDGSTSGRQIREGLEGLYGYRKSLPSFYQLMSRLEYDGLANGWYVLKVVDSQPIKERLYSLTANGKKRLKETREFYSK